MVKGTVVSRIAAAKWNAEGGRIEAEVLSELIVCAVGSPNTQLLRLTRDLVTQSCTKFETFTHCVKDAIHLRQPDLDTRLVEQRFLADQYRVAVKAAYGRATGAANEESAR
jgi:hypothetical protein